jgi:acyl-CoA reductase-like NAD-dependent aldehyde dehydrogenase
MSTYANYINGQWVDSSKTTRNINPADLSDVIGEYAQATEQDTQAAIAAARQAAPAWGLSTPQQRFDILDRAGSAILARKEELGKLLAREEGKTLAEAIGEAGRAGQIFKFFAGETLRQTGELVPSVRPGLTVEITREPVGVVGLITPWNFPIAIPAWKIAPALAFGNCVVIKPADLVPACTWELVKILADAGLPAGVLNLVMGRGSVVGEALVNSPDVDAISFTGSVGTGRSIAQKCMATGKKVQLEMGGKNPMVVLDDADLPTAVEACINGAFFSTGQRCTASSRLIVTEGIHDRFVEAMLARMKQLRVGNPLDAETHIGPVVDDKQLKQDLDYIDIARSEGATVHGGELVEHATKGHFLQPALAVNTHNDMRINREEVFGPFATVIKVKDYDEALKLANDTEFGLAAGICSTSLKHVQHFKRHAQAGMVMVNVPTAGVDYHVPFGGRKGSSHGPREQGSYAKEFYTIVKTAYVNAG